MSFVLVSYKVIKFYQIIGGDGFRYGTAQIFQKGNWFFSRGVGGAYFRWCPIFLAFTMGVQPCAITTAKQHTEPSRHLAPSLPRPCFPSITQGSSSSNQQDTRTSSPHPLCNPRPHTKTHFSSKRYYTLIRRQSSLNRIKMPLNRIPSFGQQEKGGSHPLTASMPK